MYGMFRYHLALFWTWRPLVLTVVTHIALLMYRVPNSPIRTVYDHGWHGWHVELLLYSLIYISTLYLFAATAIRQLSTELYYIIPRMKSVSHWLLSFIGASFLLYLAYFVSGVVLLVSFGHTLSMADVQYMGLVVGQVSVLNFVWLCLFSWTQQWVTAYVLTLCSFFVSFYLPGREWNALQIAIGAELTLKTWLLLIGSLFVLAIGSAIGFRQRYEQFVMKGMR